MTKLRQNLLAKVKKDISWLNPNNLFYLLVLFIPSQLGIHFWPDSALVFGIRVDYLSPTIYFTDVIIFFILFLWLINKSIKIRTSFFTIRFFILLLFFAIVGIIVPTNKTAAIYTLIKTLEFYLLFLFVSRNFGLKINRSIFKLMIFIAGTYSIILAIIQLILGRTIGGVYWWLGERNFSMSTPGISLTSVFGRVFLRPYATFPHPNVLAGILFVILCLLLDNIKLRPKRKITIFIFVSGGIFLLTFSFSLLISAFIALVFILFKLNVKNVYPLLIKISFLAIVLISFLLPFIPVISNQESFYNRQELARSAFVMAQNNLLFGVGLNNFIQNLPNYNFNNSIVWFLQPVHNIYLLVLSQTGLVGIVIFLSILWKTLLRIYQNKNRFFILLSLMFIITTGFFDHYWLTLQQGEILFTIILAIVWSKNERKYKNIL